MCVFGDVLVSVSEPPVRLWPAGCWEHGEGGRALETSPLTAWMCGGGCHPAEQVSEISASTQGFPWFLPFYRTLSISVSLLELISFTLIRGRTLMGVIFLTVALLVTFSCASCFPSVLLSPLLPASLFSLFSHDRLIHPGSVLMSVHETTGCSSKAPQHVAYVEHVVVRFNISHGRRGDLSITLTSPLGTTSQLLANR